MIPIQVVTPEMLQACIDALQDGSIGVADLLPILANQGGVVGVVLGLGAYFVVLHARAWIGGSLNGKVSGPVTALLLGEYGGATTPDDAKPKMAGGAS